MKRRLLLALPALLAACASPDPRYFTLAAVPAPAGGFLPPGPKLVELHRIGLAGYLDRPEIVRNQADYRLDVGGRDQWGEPLGALVARTLAEDLTNRLPGTTVFTSQSTITADPDATVELDLQRFDADATGQVMLLAQVAVSTRKSRDRAASRTVRLVVHPGGPGTTALVAALSQALAQLSDQVAQMLRTTV